MGTTEGGRDTFPLVNPPATHARSAEIILGYSAIMEAEAPTVQRSFRLSSSTAALLDQLAVASNQSRNALADRMLGESVRLERHPLVTFRLGAAGRREPMLTGTRLLVRQVIASVKGHDGDIDGTAEFFTQPSTLIRAAVSYYADFTDEIEADIAWAAEIEADERTRWEREQAAVA